jgi:hypothetical protein
VYRGWTVFCVYINQPSYDGAPPLPWAHQGHYRHPHRVFPPFYTLWSRVFPSPATYICNTMCIYEINDFRSITFPLTRSVRLATTDKGSEVKFQVEKKGKEERDGGSELAGDKGRMGRIFC